MTIRRNSPRDAARMLGAHYSPRVVVDELVSLTLGTLLRQRRWSLEGELPRICDPSCGAGVFLVSALERLARWMARRSGGEPAPGWLASRLGQCVFGVDVSPSAVEAARAAVGACAVRWDPACAGIDLAANIVVGNSLVAPEDGYGDREGDGDGDGEGDATWRPVRFRERFPGGDESGRFDVVVGNPPYVDSEEMVRSAPALRRYLAGRYATATGNWDLFCPFVERAVELLGADGRLGLILPNKLLSAGYARRLRERLAALDLVLLRDYAGVRLFNAAVYPLVIVARRKPRRRPVLRVEVATGELESRNVELRGEVVPTQVVESAADGWSSLFASAPAAASVESARLVPLGEVARVVGAASVAEAYALQPLVRECDHDGGCHRLVNTGTLDPYQVLWGQRRLRYLGATYERPCVACEDLERELPRRAAQARGPKIIVAGLARRLECVLDTGGLLAGKSTSLVLAPEGTDDAAGFLTLLLGLLNSAAASARLRQQFGGLALSSGYLRIGPPQLRALRIPDLAGMGRALRLELRAAALGRLEKGCWSLWGLEPPGENSARP